MLPLCFISFHGSPSSQEQAEHILGTDLFRQSRLIEKETADKTSNLTGSQCFNTTLLCPSTDPVMLCAWQDRHKNVSFQLD